MSWWQWLLIVVAVAFLAMLTTWVPSIARYLRIKRM
jgi:hypothetical protein